MTPLIRSEYLPPYCTIQPCLCSFAVEAAMAGIVGRHLSRCDQLH